MKPFSTELSYAVRLTVVAKYVGLMLLISSAILIFPLIFSLIWQEFATSERYSVIIAIFLILGLLSLKIPRPQVFQSNEAYVVIALTFFLMSLAMVYPLSQEGVSFANLWFESMSGITTTGLSTIDLNAIHTKTFFITRSWMQWYGGLGFVVLSLGLAFQPGQVSRELFKQAADREDVIESSKIFAQKILLIYSTLTVVAVVALLSVGLSVKDAFCLTFSSISTGGFSPYSDSLAGYSYGIQSLIIFFSFLGAISFPLFWISRLHDIKRLIFDKQLRILIVLIIFFALFFTFLFSSNWFTFFPKGVLNAISFQTTTGFSTLDFSGLNKSSKFLFVLSMMIGGSTQSTSGGLKILRLIIIIRALNALFFRTTLPKHAYEKQNGEDKFREINACFCFFALYMSVIFISTFLFIIYGYDPLDSLFEVVSALGTVGASSGLTGPDLPDVLKFVLGIDMFFGRLEIVTTLVLLYPRTFLGRRLIQ